MLAEGQQTPRGAAGAEKRRFSCSSASAAVLVADFCSLAVFPSPMPSGSVSQMPWWGDPWGAGVGAGAQGSCRRARPASFQQFHCSVHFTRAPDTSSPPQHLQAQLASDQVPPQLVGTSFLPAAHPKAPMAGGISLPPPAPSTRPGPLSPSLLGRGGSSPMSPSGRAHTPETNLQPGSPPPTYGRGGCEPPGRCPLLANCPSGTRQSPAAPSSTRQFLYGHK